jgi:hypothetical protein
MTRLCRTYKCSDFWFLFVAGNSGCLLLLVVSGIATKCVSGKKKQHNTFIFVSADCFHRTTMFLLPISLTIELKWRTLPPPPVSWPPVKI